MRNSSRLVRHLSWCFLCVALVLSAAPARSASPSHAWNRSFGSDWLEEVRAVAVDAAGSVFLTGYFHDTLSFGGPALTSDPGSADAFLVKLDAQGNHLWSKSFGGDSTDEGTALAVDANGNVTVAGSFVPPASFGGATLTTGRTFLAKFDAAGVHQWSQSMGSPLPNYAHVTSLAADPSGHVLMTGRFAGSVSIGGVGLVGAGSDDIFVAKFHSSGATQWVQRFGGGNADQGFGVASDAEGHVYLTGRISGTVNFGGSPLVASGAGDVFLAKFDPLGVHQWSQRFGGFSFDVANAVATDPAGNVFITGEFEGTASFGGALLTNTSGTRNVFLAKYASDGSHVWSRGFAGNAFDAGRGVATDGDGNVTITGTFGNFLGDSGYSIDFGGALLSSQGESDVFLAQFDSIGAHRWSIGFGNSSSDVVEGIGVDASGDVTIAGNFRGRLDILGAPLVSAGELDIYVAKYGADLAEPAIHAVVDVGNDQGRQVHIAFARSGLDAAGRSIPVLRYDAYRRSDAPPNVVSREAPNGGGWQFMGSIPAHGESEYLMRSATLGDSTAANGVYHSTFFVRAVTRDAHIFYDSAPDSGYSIDNLAPAVPANLQYRAGQLSWHTSNAPDFDHFTVYGAASDALAAATVVQYTVTASLDVSGSAYAYYFVTATDRSGNESPAASIQGMPGVSDAPRHHVLSVSNHPNPFNPRTTLHYTVPAPGAVTVAIYDARGARVATLVDGEHRAAGAFAIDWNGATDAGAGVASGIYFARITHEGAVRSKKLVALK